MGRRLRLFGLAVLALVLLLVGISAIEIQSHRVGDLAQNTPPTTALMRQRGREAEKKGRRWHPVQRTVSYSRVSPLLRRAILVAEDDKFFSHDGLDWDEIQASARKNLEEKRVARGGSTITQQLAKNLFLGEERSLTRKLKEAFLAFRLERALGKRRIFELYLNLIEWGDGVFGAEAAARHYFGVSASGLSERQAVLLAAVIINPRRYSVKAPPRRIERRVRMIASRMRRRGYLSEAQYAAALGRAPEPKAAFTDWFFGGKPEPSPAPEPETSPMPAEAADSSMEDLSEPALDDTAEAPPPQ